MRSSVGVGMTPPKVAGAPKPTSSVMISRMFGAPFGGTTRAAHAGFDCRAFRLISPWNGAGGCGRERPSIVGGASGEPGVPVVCCPVAEPTASSAAAMTAKAVQLIVLMFVLLQYAYGLRFSFT